MTALGTSLMVGGTAFLISGLIFVLLPGRAKRLDDQRTIEESREEIDRDLRDLRREPGDLS
jgi:hypothetical protein